MAPTRRAPATFTTELNQTYCGRDTRAVEVSSYGGCGHVAGCPPESAVEPDSDDPTTPFVFQLAMATTVWLPERSIKTVFGSLRSVERERRIVKDLSVGRDGLRDGVAVCGRKVGEREDDGTALDLKLAV